MARVIVELPAVRSEVGWIRVENDRGELVAGAFPVCGRASDKAAAQHGNPARSPLLPYGDTPLGEYRIRQTSASGNGTVYPVEKYGAHGVAILTPIAGEAALAEANGRFFFLIQGGSTGRLRPTCGSLRLFDEHQRQLMKAIENLGSMICSCYLAKRHKRAPAIDCGLDSQEADPPPKPECPHQLTVPNTPQLPLNIQVARKTGGNGTTRQGKILDLGSGPADLPLRKNGPEVLKRRLPKTTLVDDTRWGELVSQVPDRKCFEAALWRLWTGAPWTALPKEFPNAAYCFQQTRCWYENGIWVPLWRSFIGQLDPSEQLAWSKSFLDESYAPERDGSSESLFDFGLYWTSAKLFLSSWSGDAPPSDSRAGAESSRKEAKAGNYKPRHTSKRK